MHPKYRLGIDIGTNSLGWCALRIDAVGETRSNRNRELIRRRTFKKPNRRHQVATSTSV
jgi:CRISPR/Cas system Type II protein with McrA/HNH and RuvC-like nuclease domain